MPSEHSFRPLILLLATFSLAAVLLLLPFQGSLSVQVTRAAATAFAGSPGIELLSDIPLVLLALATAIVMGRAWSRRSPHRRAATLAAGGVVIAYVMSEGLKYVAAEPRPCMVWDLPGDCPPVGDWSLPSNHATLAFGAVVVIAVATRSLAATGFGVLLAVVVAAGRVLAGAHYLHDVAAGAALGLLVVGAVPVIAAVARRHQVTLSGR